MRLHDIIYTSWNINRHIVCGFVEFSLQSYITSLGLGVFIDIRTAFIHFRLRNKSTRIGLRIDGCWWSYYPFEGIKKLSLGCPFCLWWKQKNLLTEGLQFFVSVQWPTPSKFRFPFLISNFYYPATIVS